MYIQYRAIDPSTESEVLEIAEMIGITLNPNNHFVILTLAENYMDIYFKMKEEDYEKIIDEICNNLDEGKNVYRIKHIGVMYDVSYFIYNYKKNKES